MNQQKVYLSDELREYLVKLPDIDIDQLVDVWSQPLPESFRVNTLKLPEKHILERLRNKNIRFKKIPWTRYGYILEENYEIGVSLEHMLGLIYIQGPVSMAPVEVLDPKPGEIVLDMCAAPGSKSTQIAQLMEGRGVLVANDPSIERCKALSSNLQKFGVLNVVVTTLDGRAFPKMVGEFFDKVLVDAPCSSLGIISKDWSVGKNWTLKHAKRLSRLQNQLLKAAFDVLKPGGVLVYSTCTLTVEENEMVVNNLIESREDAVVEKIYLDGLRYREGIIDYDGLKMREEIKNTVRIYPYHNNAEGFYIAKIVKKV
ncbi:MAG: RsmB/NOP family class I SAM-dependent RNA methyltransferase [Nitrososphaerota archaeon]